MSSTSLKLIALALMLIDHTAQFIPGIPIWFHWLGRISAPLFMFCVVWGFYYTHDRRIYLTRMYLFGVGMAFMDAILNIAVKGYYTVIDNNIFVTLLLVCIIVAIIEEWKKDRKRFFVLAGSFVALQILSGMLCKGCITWFSIRQIANLVGAILPNMDYTEGSYYFVIMGVAMYFVKDKKVELCIVYGVFSMLFIVFGLFWGLSEQMGIVGMLLYGSYQWMMIFALPLMLAYNEKKGSGLKYLFYIFYPAHIAVLFLIGNVIYGAL